ncbi:MAG: hypothetical protein J6Z22_06045 [Lachnospiraceae bacterium]|nr:hypothetical protein [Lachnospiraceae bacterium]
MKTKRTLRWVAWLMAFCLILNGIPANTLEALAADKTSIAQVYYLWADNTNDETIAETLVIADTQPEGLNLVGKYVTGGIYPYEAGDENLIMILNEAHVYALSLDDLPQSWILSGETGVDMRALTISTDPYMYEAYDGEINAGDMLGFYQQEPYGNPDFYDWTVRGNYEINGFASAGDINILEGASLTIGTYVDEEDTQSGATSGGYLKVYAMYVSGQLIFEMPDRNDRPACVEAYSALFLYGGATVQAYDGAMAAIHEGASCDLLVFDSEGDKMIESPFAEYMEFNYDAGSQKWLAKPNGGFDVPQNRFRLEYATDYDYDVPQNLVYINNDFYDGDMEYDFVPGEELNFTLVPRQENLNQNLYVEIEVDGGIYYRNYGEECNLVVQDYSFSYTPETSAGFYVRIWWNDYERFCGDWETEFTLESNCANGSITVSPDVSGTYMMMHPFEPNRSRRIYNKSVTSLTFTLTPEEGHSLYDVSLWYDGYEEHYKVRDLEQNDMLLDEEHGFTEEDGVYTFTTPNLQNVQWVSMWAYFEDEGGGFYVEDNSYYVDFDDWYDQEQNVRHGWVKVNDAPVGCREMQSFEAGRELTFVLHQPEEKAGQTPIVHINLARAHYSSVEGEVDENHLINFTKDGQLYSFTFTPETDDGFEVMVWWSDFDRFGPNENEFIVNTFQNGEGSIVFMPGTEEFMNDPVDARKNKYVYSNDIFANGGKLTIAITPGAEYFVNRITIEEGGNRRTEYMIAPRGDNQNFIYLLDPENGIPCVDGTYYIELTQPPVDNWCHIDADFWYCYEVDSSLSKNQYYVNYDERYDEGNEEMHAWVKVNNTVIRNETKTSFVKGQTMEFLLHPHEARVGLTPIVKICLKNGVIYSTRPGEGTFDIELTQVGNEYTFSFVPESDEPFKVDVAWSEFDRFEYDGGRQFAVDTNYIGQGEIYTIQEPDHFMVEPGQGTTGVRRAFNYDIFDNGGVLQIVFEPKDGYYLKKVDLHSVNKHYTTYYPYQGENEEYILDEGSGFEKQGSNYVLTLMSRPADTWYSISAEFEELPGGVTFTTYGDVDVLYALPGMPQFVHTIINNAGEPEIPRTTFENFDSIRVQFIPMNENTELYGACVRYDDRYGQRIEHYVPLTQDYCFTLQKVHGEWPAYQVEVLTWPAPLDNEYVFEVRGDGEVSLGNDLEFGVRYPFTTGNPIDFSVIGDHYLIQVIPNSEEWFNMHSNDGNYSYNPGTYHGVRFVIYTTQAIFDFDQIMPYDQNQFMIEYAINTDDRVHDKAGGQITFNDELEILDSVTYNDRTRLLLVQNMDLIHVTIQPEPGFAYSVGYDGIDYTAEVMANGNTFVWDVSDPHRISHLEVFFFLDESQTAVIRYAKAAFDGKLGLIFGVEIPEWLKYDPNAYATFERDGEITRKSMSSILQTPVDSYNACRFAIYVPAAYYRDTIVLKIYEGDGTPVCIMSTTGNDYTESGVPYTLKRYVDNLMRNESGKIVKLAKAMDDYCTAAQIYFDYKNENYSVSADIENITQEELAQYKSVRSGTLPTSVSGVTLTGSFAADNTLKLGVNFYGNKPSNLRYYIDGVEATLRGSKSSGYYLAVRNIPAAEIGKPHDFMITDGSSEHTYTITCSLYSYFNAYAFRNNDANTRALVRAAYLYGEAAKDYFGVNY